MNVLGIHGVRHCVMDEVQKAVRTCEQVHSGATLPRIYRTRPLQNEHFAASPPKIHAFTPGLPVTPNRKV